MKIGNKYKCTYMSWNWNEYIHWHYIVRTAWKVKFTMELYSEWGYPSWIMNTLSIYFEPIGIRVKDWATQSRWNKNCVDNWDEKEFICYLNREWTPFKFTKI